MAFTESWVETDPDGSVITVSQLDNFERATKRQVRERLEGDPANLNLSGVFETFGTGAVVKKGVARAFVDTIANIGSYPLQDGRIFIASDSGRVYHLKGSGAIEFQYLPIVGGTLTGDLAISKGAADGGVIIAANAGQNRYLRFRSGQDRWVLTTTATAESGGNAGSDFTINRYDDGGALIGTVLALTRSSGLATFYGDVRHSGNWQLNSLANEGSLKLLSTGGGAVNWTWIAQTNDRLGLNTSGAGGSGVILVDPSGPVTFKNQLIVSTGGVVATGDSAITGNLAVIGTASNRSIEIRSNNTTKRSLFWTTGGSVRWEAYTDTTNEGGGNSGSNWHLTGYGDGGAIIDDWISIFRSTGQLLLTSTAQSRFQLKGIANASAPSLLDLHGSPVATPTAYVRIGGLYGDFAAGVPSKFGVFSDSVDLELKSLNSANTINLLNKVSLATTGVVAATSVLDINKDHVAAAFSAYVKLNRQGGAKAFLGLDLSDNFVVADSSGTNINLTVQNSGAVVVRRGQFIIDQGVAYPQMQWTDGSNTLECGWSANIFFFKQTQATQRAVKFRTSTSVDILTIDFNSGLITAEATAIFNAVTGFRVNGAAVAGRYLRGDGTNFVSNTIQNSDLPNPLNPTSFQVNSGATISRLLNASLTWNPNAAGIAAGSFANTAVTVAGAQVGDMVWVPNPWGIDDAKYIAVGWVSAVNTVTVQLMNPTSAAGAATTSRTVKVWVLG